MKQTLIILFAAVIFTSCQKQQKIAFVDNGKVINDYKEKVDLEEKYKIKNEAFTQKIDSVRKAVQLEANALDLKVKNLSKSKAEKEYQDFGQKQQVLQQQFQFEQQQLQQGFQKEMDSIIVKVKDFVKDYGKTNSYTYILGTSDASATVMYGAESEDLTEIILTALNDDYKK